MSSQSPNTQITSTMPDVIPERVHELISQIKSRGERTDSPDPNNSKEDQQLIDALRVLLTQHVKMVTAAVAELNKDDIRILVNFLDEALKDHLSDSSECGRALALLSRVVAAAFVFPARLLVPRLEYSPRRYAAGGFGMVHRGVDPGMCVKVMPQLNSRHLVPWIREVILWAHSSHPNILPFKGLFFEDNGGSSQVCLVSPFMENGNLSEYAPRFPQRSRLPLLSDAANGLQHIHELGIVHSDLKGQNVLITKEGRAVLTDFGSSRVNTTTTAATTTAPSLTPRFAAPEVVVGGEKVSMKSDVWSFGCLCYEVLSRKTPYYQYTSTQLISVFLRKEPPQRPGTAKSPAKSSDDDSEGASDDEDEQDFDPIGDEAWYLITRCREPNPDDRLTVSQIRGVIGEILKRQEITHENITTYGDSFLPSSTGSTRSGSRAIMEGEDNAYAVKVSEVPSETQSELLAATSTSGTAYELESFSGAVSRLSKNKSLNLEPQPGNVAGREQMSTPDGISDHTNRPDTSALADSSFASPYRVSTGLISDIGKESLRPRTKKRIIRLARAINREDERQDTLDPDVSDENNRFPIQQLVFYQSRKQAETTVDGATGASLANDVEEAYVFIANNYSPGDDIYLFGFSRGAYTARMVAMFIGEIGILNRPDMDHFAGVFVNLQRRGTVKDPKELELIEMNLAPWLDWKSQGKRRACIDKDGFSVKCIGVWDTVGAFGLPDELVIKNPRIKLFGLSDPGKLGTHVRFAFQALALNEQRADFNCNKFEQTSAGREKGQVLKQCWFVGCHSDVGGGYMNHDLSDIALYWMAANVESMLGLDLKYLENHLQPVAKWGKQEPHDSVTGVFALAKTIKRDIPTKPNEKTNEFIHPSVIQQLESYPELQSIVLAHPELVCELQPLERHFKACWESKYDPGLPRAQEYAARLAKDHVQDAGIWGAGSRIGRFFTRNLKRKTGIRREGGKPSEGNNKAEDTVEDT